MSKIRAFQVTAPNYENAVIVFAESANQAKSMVAGDVCVGEYEYRDLICKREPKADQYATEKPSVLFWNRRKSDLIYYELGWQLHDAEICDWCGKSEFDTIPESIVSEREDCDWDEVCQGCYEAHKAKEGADE